MRFSGARLGVATPLDAPLARSSVAEIGGTMVVAGDYRVRVWLVEVVQEWVNG